MGREQQAFFVATMRPFHRQMSFSGSRFCLMDREQHAFFVAIEICFKFVPDGLELSSYSVSVGATPCTSCEICASGVSFKFNCSNVDLAPQVNAFFVPGPEIASCIGLSLIATNKTARV
jgi:hypothetical protein